MYVCTVWIDVLYECTKCICILWMYHMYICVYVLFMYVFMYVCTACTVWKYALDVCMHVCAIYWCIFTVCRNVCRYASMHRCKVYIHIYIYILYMYLYYTFLHHKLPETSTNVLNVRPSATSPLRVPWIHSIIIIRTIVITIITRILNKLCSN